MTTPRALSLLNRSLKMNRPTAIENSGLVATMSEVMVGDSVKSRP